MNDSVNPVSQLTRIAALPRMGAGLAASLQLEQEPPQPVPRKVTLELHLNEIALDAKKRSLARALAAIDSAETALLGSPPVKVKIRNLSSAAVNVVIDRNGLRHMRVERNFMTGVVGGFSDVRGMKA